MNGTMVGYSLNHPPTKLARMRPGDGAFWETDETEPIYFNDGANYPPEGVSGRHQAGGVQAAFDGSVSYIKLVRWHQDMAAPSAIVFGAIRTRPMDTEPTEFPGR